MKKFLSKIICFFIISAAGFICLKPSFIQAQEFEVGLEPDQIYQETQEIKLEGQIIEIVETSSTVTDQGEFKTEKFKIKINKGDEAGQEIIVEHGADQLMIEGNVAATKYQVGDKVMISKFMFGDEDEQYIITDYVRRSSLMILFVLFAGLVIIVGKLWGVTSLISMFLSFVVILKMILPMIMNGANPIMVALLGSLFIVPLTFYLSHGFNTKTHVAIAGTFIALAITGFLAVTFVNNAKLTGLSSEEAGFLDVEQDGRIDMKGLLLAGIIIGVLGTLDDITVAVAGFVFRLKEIDKKLSTADLYKKAMEQGRDHISSMVNTLILVYTGASLPLLLLFINNPHPFSEIVNYELIADEIIRTMVGSIGLIVAAPITAGIASLVAKQAEKKK